MLSAIASLWRSFTQIHGHKGKKKIKQRTSYTDHDVFLDECLYYCKVSIVSSSYTILLLEAFNDGGILIKNVSHCSNFLFQRLSLFPVPPNVWLLTKMKHDGMKTFCAGKTSPWIQPNKDTNANNWPEGGYEPWFLTFWKKSFKTLLFCATKRLWGPKDLIAYMNIHSNSFTFCFFPQILPLHLSLFFTAIASGKLEFYPRGLIWGDFHLLLD